MAGDSQINISVLMRFMADEARRQMTGTGSDLRNLGGAAEEASAKATSAGKAIDQTGAASQGAASGISTANAALSETVSAASNVTAQMGRTAMSVAGARDAVTGLGAANTAALQPATAMVNTLARSATAMQSAMSASSGLTRALGAQTAAMLEEQRAGAAWQSQLDDIRAKFNPLFAVSRQYEMELRAIAEAERDGALSAREANAARERAGQAMAPISGIVGQFGVVMNQASGHTANLFAQWNDIGVMMAAGQNPWQLALQQGTQVSQVLMQLGGGTVALRAVGASFLAMLNPISLATIGIIAFGAAGVQWLSKLGGKTESFDDVLKDLNGTLGRMRSNLDLLGTTRLEDTFGNLTGSVRGLAQGMLELDRASELNQFSDVIDKFLDKEVKEGWGQWFSRNLAVGMAASGDPNPFAGLMGNDIKQSNLAANYSAMGAANSYEDFERRTKEIKALAEGGDIDGVSKSLMALQSAMADGGSVSGMNKELRELLALLSQAGIDTAKQEAFFNGTAQANAIKHQIDQMVMGLTQQAELAETALRFGENSVELEDVRARQAREALRVKLEEMGVEAQSANAIRARGALEAQITADANLAAQDRRKSQQEYLGDLQRQLDVTAAIQRYGKDSAEVEALRASHAQDVLKARLLEKGWMPELIDAALQLTQAERDRANVIKASAAARKGDDLLTQLRAEGEINRAIVAYGQDSLQVKKLQIEAARREFEQTLATMQLTEALKGELRAAWEASRGLSAADPFGGLTAGRTYLRDQQDRIDKLRLEQSLLGQNEAIQTRMLALWQAEKDTRQQGIDATSARAAEIRAAATLEAELSRTVERQKQAWYDVQ
jgi:hypothetical protein